MTARTRSLKVPALAMVDALVCAVSILLILIVLLSQSSPEPRTVPRADLTYRCLDANGSTTAIMQEGEDGGVIALDALPAEIAKRASDAALSVRVQVFVPLDQFICGPRVSEALRRANAASEVSDAKAASPFVLLDIRHVGEDAWEGERDAEQ